MRIETNAERLKIIKQNFDSHEREYGLERDEIEWLIEQAERTQELELSCNVSNCLAKFTSYTEIENKRLRKALKQIMGAEETNLEGYESLVHRLARQALGDDDE